MVKRALILLLLFSTIAEAKVTVLSSGDCTGRLLRRSIEKTTYGDYVEEAVNGRRPPTRPSYGDYFEEAFLALHTVEQAYWDIFLKRGMSVKEAREIIHGMDNELRFAVGTGTDVNGLDNTVYFLSQRKDGTTRAIVRATLIRRGEKRKLPAESKVALPDENRVELERAFNSPDSANSRVTHELLRAAAEYFRSYFEGDGYTVYALTDSPRARLYRSRYGFKTTKQPQLDPMYGYLAHQSGADFYRRYVGGS